ncbi:hypothetical protein C8J55DRAFT_508121 [Lentinula edodes]|uniref:Fungal-type protein kinase domain-containing protein n=1 Tax=Lentinula lateritia TaxID=40482 RepID=A0A9W9DVQ9_9AGAR|nr:hypothetical protein C8J55DRAFT_508121 [Lentinula edodes]
MPSSSPRKSDSAYPPYDGTTVRQSEMRSRIKRDNADNLIECSPTTFLKTYASNKQLRSKDLRGVVMNALQEDKLLDDNGWTSLRNMGKGQNENETFAFLSQVAETIISAATKHDTTLEPQAVARPSPTATSQHSKPGYRFYPDWTAVVNVLSSSIHVDAKPSKLGASRKTSVKTSDIASIAEFKLEDTTEKIIDNEDKMAGAANQLLWNDPCRERVLGFTVEKKRTRFWDFSRCAIAVSEPFDISEKPELLVRFLLFVIFAKKHEIGFDPTVHRISVGGEDCYCYEIGKSFFLTVGSPLSEEAAYRMVGRATRVWVVVTLFADSNGDIEVGGSRFRRGDARRVLKDVWLYDEALCEREIQKSIKEKLNKEQKAKLKKHFLTFIMEEVIVFEGEPRLTPRPQNGEFQSTAWQTDPYFHQNPNPSTSRGTREKPPRTEVQPIMMSRTHTLRKHVRSVVKEECESLYQLTDFKNALICWRDMIICLDLFRIAGFIHRDLSGGNTLFFEGRGIISDLEYSKRYNEVSSHDPKTGTPDFMAAEYQANYFFFLPSPTDTTAELMKSQRQWFSPHFVHDIESVYWQYLWFLHNRIPKTSEPSQSALEEIKQQAKLYFGYGIDGNHTRFDVIRNKASNILLRGVLESVYRPLILQLLDLSITLREEYRRVVRSLPMKKSDDAWRLGDVFNGDIYEKFLGKLQAVLDAYPDGYAVITLDAAR